MADQPGAADHTTGSVRYVDPEGLHKNPAFTNVVVVEGPVRTVYVGGQNAVDGSGNIVGKGGSSMLSLCSVGTPTGGLPLGSLPRKRATGLVAP